MEQFDQDAVTKNWLKVIPPIDYVESKFSVTSGINYLKGYWGVSVIGSIIYLIVVFGGRKVMENRPAYSLRRPLVLWNGGLALFSVIGSLSIIPPLLHGLYLYGVDYSLCYAESLKDPSQGLWGFLFILSKLFEFGDTVFIVLRKKPLIFLHWYHHVTVCIYSFYMTSAVSADIARWFGGINFVVHSLMYSYYTLRALGVHVHRRVALFITLMQLSQMFVGLFVNVSAYRLYQQGLECGMEPWYFYIGMAIYGSYAVLFLHLFLSRYVCVSKKKPE